MSPTSLGRVAAMLRFFSSVSNILLLTISDYYYHSYDKMVKGKWRPGRDMVWVLVGVRGCVPWPTGLIYIYIYIYPYPKSFTNMTGLCRLLCYRTPVEVG